VCFEPRSNTARTALFQDAFTQALLGADRIYLGAVHRADSIVAENRLDTVRMVTDLSNAGREAMAFEDNDTLFEQIRVDSSSISGGVFVFFTNGAFDGLPYKTAELLS
jgi:UDP-N-acetylmuramate: L-alanyl-gamma-D-glutamyl-meso-diaminopimelate ligase